MTAQVLVRALRATTRRYKRGYIAQSTWKKHMIHLWAKVEDSGLTLQVIERMIR